MKAASLDWLALILATQGENEQAAQMWGEAQVLREIAGTPMLSAEQKIIDVWVAQVRTVLGEARFQISWAQGRGRIQEQTCLGDDAEAVPIKAASLSSRRTLPATTAVHLTPRELETLRLLCEGLTNKEIAKHLILSTVTVNSYLRTIYSKIGISSRTQAMRWAREQHLF